MSFFLLLLFLASWPPPGVVTNVNAAVVFFFFTLASEDVLSVEEGGFDDANEEVPLAVPLQCLSTLIAESTESQPGFQEIEREPEPLGLV